MGYLKNKCTGCGKRIYLKEDSDGVIRPYESWVEGTVDEGEWVLHDCHRVRAAEAKPPASPAVNPSSEVTTVEASSDSLPESVEQIVFRYMLAGVPQTIAYEIIAKISAIDDVLREHEMDVCEEFRAVVCAVRREFPWSDD